MMVGLVVKKCYSFNYLRSTTHWEHGWTRQSTCTREQETDEAIFMTAIAMVLGMLLWLENRCRRKSTMAAMAFVGGLGWPLCSTLIFIPVIYTLWMISNKSCGSETSSFEDLEKQDAGSNKLFGDRTIEPLLALCEHELIRVSCSRFVNTSWFSHRVALTNGARRHHAVY